MAAAGIPAQDVSGGVRKVNTFTLKFTPENLRRHLARKGNYGLPEALALAAMLKVNCGGEIPLEEATLQCSRYNTTLANVESRYPGLIHRFQETTVIEEDGDYQEVANIIEFGEYNDEGGQLYQQIRSTP